MEGRRCARTRRTEAGSQTDFTPEKPEAAEAKEKAVGEIKVIKIADIKLEDEMQMRQSLKILQASWGFELGARRITVSTSGITPKIIEFVKHQEGRVRLSVSLHSSSASIIVCGTGTPR